MSGGVLFKSQVGPSTGHFPCHFSSPQCLSQALPNFGSLPPQCSSHLWKFPEYSDISLRVLFCLPPPPRHVSFLGQLFQDEHVLSREKKLLKVRKEIHFNIQRFLSEFCLKLLVDLEVGGAGCEFQRDLPEAV